MVKLGGVYDKIQGREIFGKLDKCKPAVAVYTWYPSNSEIGVKRIRSSRPASATQ